KAIRHLEKGRVVIFGAGAGLPYFSTDTVSAQRALEINADAVLMSKSGVDGVYSDDPNANPDAERLEHIAYSDAVARGLRVADAERFEHIAYSEGLARGLKVADAAAFALCMENKLPMIVFGMQGDGDIARVLRGEKIGTLVHA